MDGSGALSKAEVGKYLCRKDPPAFFLVERTGAGAVLKERTGGSMSLNGDFVGFHAFVGWYVLNWADFWGTPHFVGVVCPKEAGQRGGLASEKWGGSAK